MGGEWSEVPEYNGHQNHTRQETFGSSVLQTQNGFCEQGKGESQKESLLQTRAQGEREHTVQLQERRAPGKGCDRGACSKLIRLYLAEVWGCELVGLVIPPHDGYLDWSFEQVPGHLVSHSF